MIFHLIIMKDHFIVVIHAFIFIKPSFMIVMLYLMIVIVDFLIVKLIFIDMKLNKSSLSLSFFNNQRPVPLLLFPFLPKHSIFFIFICNFSTFN